MQDQHRVQARQPQRDHLGTAGESREEMRLHESCRDLDVRLGPLGAEPDGDPGTERPGPGESRLITGVMVDDPHRVHDRVAEHCAQLAGRIGPVRAGRY